MNRNSLAETRARHPGGRLFRWPAPLCLVLLLLVAGPRVAAESGPETLLSWRSPAVEAEARMPWLPADPELAARLRRQAFAELAEFVAEAERGLAELVAENPASAGFPWLWDSRVEIVFAAPCCLSLRRDLDVDSGGAHGNRATESIFWDRRGGRVVPLDELLDLEAAKPALDAALRAAFREAQRERGLPMGGQDEPHWFGPPEAGADSVFTLIAGLRPGIARGLLFHFPPYALGPYAEGGYRLPVPASRFLAYLRPRFRRLFTAD